MTDRIFLSFKPADLERVNELLAWEEAKHFEYEYEKSGIPKVAFHSAQGQMLKDELKARIKACTHLLCIVGKDTANNDWVNWEIQTASVTGKRVIAVKLDKNCKAPASALNFGAAWADTFTYEAIRKIIELGLGGPDQIVEGAVMGGMMEG